MFNERMAFSMMRELEKIGMCGPGHVSGKKKEMAKKASIFDTVLEKISETETSEIGGKKIKEKEGKLTEDLGKPPSEASEEELKRYIESGGTEEERRKRLARVNLARAHMKGVKAQHGHGPNMPDVEGVDIEKSKKD
jgi:hypothetical protein